MRNIYGLLSTLLLIIILNLNALAQTSTLEEVTAIFQANCTVGCHSSPGASGNLDLTGTPQEVYDRLVNVDPTNPYAQSKGYKLVDPGYAERSFMFRKIHDGLDETIDLQPQEGNTMPNNSSTLAPEEIELVRQWIIFGAPDSGLVVDPQLVHDYYHVNGKQRLQPLPEPDPSEGFRVHVGPFFLAPGSEVEYFRKFATQLQESREVYRIETMINEESHHTALYKYFPEADTFFNDGLRPVTGIIDAAGVYYSSDIIGQWPNSQNLVLPEGTAFTWQENTVVDLNIHLINYNQDSILAAEAYMNVYHQPQGTAEVEMKSAPVYYGGNNPNELVILPSGQDTTFVIEQYDPDSSYTWYIWSMMAHTHQLGKDFDVWKRNPDGTKGDQIYEGEYDETYTYNQGYYDWEHPPFRTFEPLLPIDFSEGLIHEAVFNNPGPNTVYFGLSTTDEMYVTYIQYTEEPVTIGIDDANETVNPVRVFPNPAGESSRFILPESFAGKEAFISVYDLSGKKLLSIPTNGQLNTTVSLSPIASGVYLYRVNSDQAVIGQGKLIVH